MENISSSRHMRKLIPIAALVLSMLPLTAFATNPPTIDPYNKIVDASKIKITGKAEADAKITAVGGSYNIPPVTVASDGTFEVTLALTQEAENSFSFSAFGKDGIQSKEVTIVITENSEKAAELAQEGKDVTAPNPPTINYYPPKIEREDIIIAGSTEPNIFIDVTGGEQGIRVDETGHFWLHLYLNSDQENTFSLSARDKENNISQATKVTITSTLKPPEESTPEVAKPFSDIDGHWGESYIENLRLKGIVSGKQEGIFGPDDFITRAALTKIAVEAAKLPLEKASLPPFDDVPLQMWFTDYIYTAKINGIVEGFGDGTFHPEENITRAASLKIMLEGIVARPILKKYPKGYKTQTEVLGIFQESDSNFPDSKEEWFSKYTSFGRENKIVSGNSDGNFLPGNPISRAEVAKISNNVMDIAIETWKMINADEMRKRDEERVSETTSLFDAIVDYADDYSYRNDKMPDAIPTEETVFDSKLSELCEVLLETFIDEMFVDPEKGFYFKQCSDFNTGYTVQLTENKTITVKAPYTETKGIWVEQNTQ